MLMIGLGVFLFGICLVYLSFFARPGVGDADEGWCG